MENQNEFLGRINHKNIKNTIDSQRICTEKYATVDLLKFDSQILIKYIGKEILTGNEEWYFCNEKKTYYYSQFNKINVDNNSSQMLCNYFTFSNDATPEWGKFCNGKNQEIHFNFDNGEKGILYFKKWLKEKYNSAMPVEIYYVLQYPDIFCKRFYYNSNPRFKGANYSVKPQNGGLTPILSFKEEIDIENDNNIYVRNSRTDK